MSRLCFIAVFLFLLPPLSADSDLPPGAVAKVSVSRLPNELTIEASAVSADGKLLATLDRESAAVWEVATSRALGRFEFKVHDNSTERALAFAPDGRMLAVSEDSEIHLLRVPELAVVKSLQAKEPFHNAVMEFSPDGHLLAVIDSSALRVFDLASDKEIARIDDVKKMRFAPDGKTLIAATWSRVGWYEAATGKCRLDLPFVPETDSLQIPIDRPVAFSPDGHTIALGMSRGRVDLLRLGSSAKQPKFFEITQPEKQSSRRYFHAQALAFSADGQWLAGDVGDGFIHIWDANARQELYCVKSAANAESLRFLPGDKQLLSVAAGEGFIWDLKPTDLHNVGADLWEDLQSYKGTISYRALWRLADDSQTPAHLRAHVSVKKLDSSADRIKQLVADLNSQRFATRDQATRELFELEECARPFLLAELEKKPALEAQRRLTAVLDRLDGDLKPQELFAMRAVKILEMQRSDAARKVLQEWSEATPGPRLAEAARAALRRSQALVTGR